MTPSNRPEALRKDTHHCLWRAKEWKHESRTHNTVRMMGAYTLVLPRYQHDILHTVFEPIQPPSMVVVKNMLDLGHEYKNRQGTHILKDIATEIGSIANITPSPETADYCRTIAGHLMGQAAFVEMQKEISYGWPESKMEIQS